ncbi:MAG: methyltransferase domain-containing protein [Deltaproteobacteria bacterium]|nr:methyltransferase domain-containing protein [Deltaproteobacteria bacterium]
MTDDARNILRGCGACPGCGAPLVVGDEVRCERCGVTYARAGERIDLRLRSPRSARVEFVVGRSERPAPSVNLGPLPLRPDGPLEGSPLPRHLSPALASHIPRPSSVDAIALDLGCGDGVHRAPLERLGFRWLGVDFAAAGAPILADAHALPVTDAAVDFVLSVAVLEHIRHPAVMLREVKRVLRPGGRFVGTVAFLEPFHSDSYTHHTQPGTWSALHDAGFAVEHVSPSAEWQVLRAQAKNGLFPGVPRRVAVGLVRPLESLRRALWSLAALRHPALTAERRLAKLAGAFSFVATSPG